MNGPRNDALELDAEQLDWDVAYDPVPALNIAHLNALAGDAITVSLDRDEADGLMRFTLAALNPVPLRRMLPALQSMNLEVLQEQTAGWIRPDGQRCYIYNLTLAVGTGVVESIDAGWSDAQARIRETFHAIWSGRCEADGFNGLILGAALTWRQTSVLRSFSRYLRQLPLPYSQGRVQTVLSENPGATTALVRLFDARFDRPERPADDTDRRRAIEAAEADVAREIDSVVHIDADRILSAYRNLISATQRTNAFTPEALGPTAPFLVYKFDSSTITELPQPRPLSEIFVYSPDFEGVHLRFGLVARGGLRWSDRHDDYRTEVLGLVKAQAVKNAVIVPAGAKGVFVVKDSAQVPGGRTGSEPNAFRARGLSCYRQFISALLYVVDTTPRPVTPPFGGVVKHDGPDPYLVVAADKGTATFSDTANAIAVERDYWLGDAFASGGSAGYDHKAMGITARGAWVSGKHHLAKLDIDPSVDAFTAIGIGDMSGDVFGNGMLLQPHLRLIAAFDHRHIFIDPDPHPSRGHHERRRLFNTPRSTWDHYDRAAISTGGGVWSRTAKSIPLSAPMRAALGIGDNQTSMSPNELISRILRAPVDVLFNGGVGTYIKASTETHTDVADKINDALRVDATDLRARVIIEGGNLGVTQRGRIQYARNGGLINTDAIDNAAGVDCSDHEVNIKVLLNTLIQHGKLDRSQRNALLVEMTDEVARRVLDNNEAHCRLLSDTMFNAAQMVDVHARMVTALVNSRGLDRDLDHLPSPSEFRQLAKTDAGLTSPELATLLAHVKLDLKTVLLADPVVDDPYYTATFIEYFPATVASVADAHQDDHPLRREIVATSLVNKLLATAGLTYAFRLTDETGATPADIVRAHAIVTHVFDLDSLWADIYDAKLAPALTNSLIIEGRRLLDRASRWFLLNRPQPLHIEQEVARFADTIRHLRKQLSTMLHGTEKATVDKDRLELTTQGVPDDIAARISESLYAFSLLDITEVACTHSEDPQRLAEVYFELSNYIGVDSLLLAVSALPRGDRWHSQARLAVREDLYRSLRDVTLDVFRRAAESTDITEEFEQYNHARIRRARRTLDDFRATDHPDLAVVSVASAQLRRLTTTRA